MDIVQSALLTECRILIAEDYEDTAESMAVVLEAYGYKQIQIVKDGEIAIEAAIKFNPHVILLDIGLPHVTGWTIATHLRTLPAFEKTLIIAISGYGWEEHIEQSCKSGIDYHLLKPVRIEVIDKLIHRKLSLT